MHIEDLTEKATIIFSDTMQALGFKQHVTRPTHKQGNTLDLLFTDVTSEIQVTNCATHGYISDHNLGKIDSNLNKEKYGKKVKTIQDTTKMTKKTLKSTLYYLDLKELHHSVKQSINLIKKCKKCQTG